MTILHLTLKKKWFDMIASGEKKEEYRDLKMYWAVRLMNGFPSTFGIDTLNPDFKDFDTVKFTHGYKKGAPTITLVIKKITIGDGKYEWGATSNEKYFVIKLGNILKPQP